MDGFDRRTALRTLLAVAALAILVRLLVVAAFDAPVCCDAEDYLRHARSVAAGDGMAESQFGGPTLLRAPVYPVVLGALLAVAPGSIESAAVFAGQAALGGLAAGLLALLAWQLFGDRRHALAAGALAALYPAFALEPLTYMTEIVFLPLELAALAALLHLRRGVARPGVWSVGIGVLVGLAMLTRQTGALLLAPVGLALLVAPGDPVRARLRRLAAITAVSLVVVAPWTVRNYVVSDTFVLITRQTGLQLSGIYNEDARLDPARPAYWPDHVLNSRDFDAIVSPDIDELELDELLQQRSLDHARDHPAYVAEAVARNGLRMLELDRATWGATSDSLSLSSSQGAAERIGWFVAVALAVGGWLTSGRRRVPWWLLATPVVFFAAGATSGGLLRYRIPADPFVLLLAAAGLVAVLDHVGPRVTARTATSG
jgi:4-amino-4-deoxy-L-arabinose transferase-like glycosyltransferase